MLTLLLTAACSGDDAKPLTGSSLRLVAGSEQETVLDTIVKPWCEAKEYDCRFTLKGSVDQARLLSSGSKDYDAYWFASSVFSQLGDKGGSLQDVKSMFLTPIVYAGWKSEMDRLGFVGKPDVTIADILDAVESGKTTVRVTNPTQSNSGATVLFGFMNHFAGNGPGQPLTQQQLDSPQVEQGITRFVQAMAETPPSTGTLMNECVADQTRCKTFFTYEDLVIEKNEELVKAGREPLYAVYPRGSLAISDAPLGFRPLGEFDSSRRKIVDELQNYLLNDASVKAKLLKLGRRPATSIGLTLDNPDLTVFNPAWGIQATLKEQGIQYPSSSVIETALDRYQTNYRKPVDVYYCLDGSGSMGENNGWKGVKAAAAQVFDQDQARLNLLLTGPKDRTTVAIFNSGLTAGSPWTVEGNDAGQLHSLTTRIQGYEPDGGTNMYQCLARATSQLRDAASGGRKALIIVMSDGKSDRGGHDNAVQQAREIGVPIVSIAFGKDADTDQLKEVANATGGSFYQQDDLVSALRNAAGYR